MKARSLASQPSAVVLSVNVFGAVGQRITVNRAGQDVSLHIGSPQIRLLPGDPFYEQKCRKSGRLTSQLPFRSPASRV
jgi:hypothetical protein